MVCVIAWSSSSTLCGEFTRCIHSTRIFSLLPHLIPGQLNLSSQPYSAKQRFIDSASTESLRPCPVYPFLRKCYCLKGGLCSSKARLPLVPYFFSWATGKSFHRFRALGSLQFFQEYSLLAV